MATFASDFFSETFGGSQTDVLLSLSCCRLRHNYCQLKDARTSLQEQLQSQENRLEPGGFHKVSTHTTCRPSEILEHDHRAMKRNMDYEEHDSSAATEDDAGILQKSSENEALQKEVDALRAERERILFERDDLAHQVVQARTWLNSLQTNRDVLHKDCQNRGACAMEFAKEIVMVQDELNKACIERDECSEHLENAATEVSQLRDRVSLNCSERDDYNQLIARAAVQIVGLRMEKDRLINDSVINTETCEHLHHEYASCRTELEQTIDEQRSMSLQLDGAMHTEATMLSSLEIMKTELAGCKRFVEEQDVCKSEMRAYFEALSAEEGLCSERAARTAEESHALRSELQCIRAEQLDECRLLKHATDEFAIMRTELGCMRQQQQGYEEQRRTTATELTATRQELMEVEEMFGRSQIRGAAECTSGDSCKAYRSELESQEALCKKNHRTAEREQERVALLQSELSQANTTESEMSRSVEIAESELTAMQKHLHELRNHTGVVELARVTQTNEILQDEVRTARNECNQYCLYAENMTAELSELTSAIKSRSASAVQTKHGVSNLLTTQSDNAEMSRAQPQLRQQLSAHGSNMSNVEIAQLESRLENLRADVASEAASRTLMQLQENRSHRAMQASLYTELRNSQRGEEKSVASLRRCEDELDVQRRRFTAELQKMQVSELPSQRGAPAHSASEELDHLRSRLEGSTLREICVTIEMEQAAQC